MDQDAIIDACDRFLLDESWGRRPKDPSLASGLGGLALYVGQAILQDGGQSAGLETRLETVVNEMITEIGELHGNPFMFSGISGVGFALDRLAGASLLDAGGDDLCLPIDLSLMDFFKQGAVPAPASGCAFDVIGGVAGIGIYAAGRPKGTLGEDLLLAASRWLAQTACWDDDGCCRWEITEALAAAPVSPAFRQRDWIFGAAHGAQGVFPVLAMADVLGDDRADACLRGGIKWTQKYDRKRPLGGRCPVSVPKAGDTDGGTRLSWCYGDLGISALLASTAKILGDDGLGDYAQDIGEECARRTLDDGTLGVSDACLCHGSAGNMALFSAMYDMTNLSRYQVASELWKTDALKTKWFGEDLFAPARNDGKATEPQDHFSLLSGTLGAAMALKEGREKSGLNWLAFLGLVHPFASSLRRCECK